MFVVSSILCDLYVACSACSISFLMYRWYFIWERLEFSYTAGGKVGRWGPLKFNAVVERFNGDWGILRGIKGVVCTMAGFSEGGGMLFEQRTLIQ